MSHVVVCEIGEDALPHLHALRLAHLEYILARRGEILFGGPARDADGLPQTMIIVLATASRAEAEAFIAAEPYNASGRVFRAVTVRSWSQMLPDPEPGALERAFRREAAAAAARSEAARDEHAASSGASLDELTSTVAVDGIQHVGQSGKKTA